MHRQVITVQSKTLLEKACRPEKEEKICLSTIYHRLARTLRGLDEIQYKGMDTNLPGHCVTPKVLFWARKTVQRGDNEYHKDHASKLIAELEALGKTSCANCGKQAKDFGIPLKQCANCRAIWYCGRDLARYALFVISL